MATRPRRGSPETFAQLLPKVLEEVGLDRASSAVELIHAWDEALGEAMAGHCRPEGIRSGVVSARVRDSAWMARIQLDSPRILDALRCALADTEVRELRLRIGPLDV